MTEPRVTIERRRSDPQDDRRLRSIIEQLADGIVIVGADGLILFANPTCGTLFGRGVDTLTGTEFGFPISSGEAAEIDLVRPDGKAITAELRVGEISWEGTPARLVSVRDITDRRNADERARQIERERAARAEAEAANRAKSEFLATMSHELRTPLNAVMGYAQLLDVGIGGTLSAEQHKQVDRIMSSSQHLLGLVNELLDLAKVDAGQLEVHIGSGSAARTSEGAVALIQPSAEGRGISIIKRRAQKRLLQYAGDEDRVRQILVNLLGNAVKFTDTGGHVTIEFGQTEEPDAEARLHGKGTWTYFKVTDDGIGIPADQLSRIFERFVQVEGGLARSNEGSGLGLAISRRLARLMRGDITVRSNVGEGSVFALWLPSADPERPQVASSSDEYSTEGRSAHGLGPIGEIIIRDLQTLIEAIVLRLRAESPMPGTSGVKFSQLADHIAAFLADLASMLVAIDESEGQPSSLLTDAADLHRMIAERHGLQRARLGWNDEAIRRESQIIREEVERVVRQGGPALGSPIVDEAISIIGRLIKQAEIISGTALSRAAKSV